MKKRKNNGIFYVVISLVAVLGLGLGVVAFTGNAERVIENVELYQEATQSQTFVDDGNLGGAGPDKYFRQFFHDGFGRGGTIEDATTTMQIAFTLTAEQVCSNEIVTVNSGCAATTAACAVAAAIDITFPATSTLWTTCLQNNGDEVEFLFSNLSPTAASTTEIVAGTGGKLYEDDGSDVLIDGGHHAKIIIKRFDEFESNEDYILLVEEFIEG